jgi:transposase
MTRSANFRRRGTSKSSSARRCAPDRSKTPPPQKYRLQELVGIAAQPETNRLWRTVCRWWNEIEVLIVTGATTAKVEANNTAIKHLKRTGRGFVNSRNYTTRIMLRSAARTAA